MLLTIILAMAMQAAAPAAASPIAPVLAASGLPPLAGEAIRFTDLAPGGHSATIFEARRTASGIERTIVALSHDEGAGWSVASNEKRRLAAETFDYMAGRIDAAIATGATASPCQDGTDSLSEHATVAGVRQIEGACPDSHPNAAIAQLFGVREER